MYETPEVVVIIFTLLLKVIKDTYFLQQAFSWFIYSKVFTFIKKKLVNFHLDIVFGQFVHSYWNCMPQTKQNWLKDIQRKVKNNFLEILHVFRNFRWQFVEKPEQATCVRPWCTRDFFFDKSQIFILATSNNISRFYFHLARTIDLTFLTPGRY